MLIYSSVCIYTHILLYNYIKNNLLKCFFNFNTNIALNDWLYSLNYIVYSSKQSQILGPVCQLQKKMHRSQKKATYSQPVPMCSVFICSLHFINGSKEWMVLSNFKCSCEGKIKTIIAKAKY